MHLNAKLPAPRKENMRSLKTLTVALALVLILPAVSARANGVLPKDLMADGRAVLDQSMDLMSRTTWLMNRSGLQDMALTGLAFDQSLGDEFGSGGGYELEYDDGRGAGAGAGLTLLASAVLPGAGEALLGHRRGYAMMAADIFSWTQVAKHHGDGVDKRDEYYAFADEHYSDELLVEAYKQSSDDFERGGEGTIYFPDVGYINDTSELGNLPLYVTVEEDRREYYENLGKWDQFIFGWDDYTKASIDRPEYGYQATGQRGYDLQQPWVSENRDRYRQMRVDSNDSFKSRDRWMYFNIGLRVFSVLQVAYLQGMLGGGGNELEVAGHPVEIIAQPQGLTRGVVATKVAF